MEKNGTCDSTLLEDTSQLEIWSGGEVDEDTCNVQDTFPCAYSQLASCEAGLAVLHLDTTDGHLAVGKSSGHSVYDLTTLTSLQHMESSFPSIGACFRNGLLYTGNEEEIQCWDLRQKLPAVSYVDTSGGEQQRPFLSFDLDCSGRVICAGTAEMQTDAYHLFWDLRAKKLLGGWWDSHQDDITQVCFHPTKCNILSSGSTDGLINIFDINQSNEDDALLHSLNTESSVSKIKWLRIEGNTNLLSCVTHTECLQIWSMESVAPDAEFNREKITRAIKRTVSEDCYVVGTMQAESDDAVLVMAGSSSESGGCLRMVEAVKRKLKPYALLTSEQPSSDVVRCCYVVPETQVILTGDDTGIVRLWKSNDGRTHAKEIAPIKTKKKSHRTTPY